MVPKSSTEAKAVQSNTDEELSWLLVHKDLFPDGKVEHSIENPELIHFLYLYGTGNQTSFLEPVLSAAELTSGIPYLYQWDERWGFKEYGSSVIGITGCGPTCLSMAIIGLTGKTDITPV